MKSHHPFALAALLAASSLPAAEPPPFTPAQPAAIKNWQDARFGMFIHWGPVSLKGTEIGWSRGAQIPIEEYDNLYRQFNPTKFNADEWVAVAKAAGMKYLVLTTKHHDGFCLWDTKQTEYNIMNSPFRRDVLKELAVACKKGGVALGTYHSTCDWHHPDFPLTSPGGKVKRDKSDIEAYTKYIKAQTTELLTNYGPLFTLWYDVPQQFDATRGAGLINLARSIQPDIVINNRTGAKGDYDTPEQRIGGFQIDRPWETCMTICRQWAWKPDDKMKSLEECLQTLIRTNGGNGNLLFNVGPMPTGEIEPRQVERLKEMGAWLAKNGETIYGTRGGPWKPTPTFACTRKGNKVFLHLLGRADAPLALKAPPMTITAARIFNGPALPFTVKDDTLNLSVPPDAWQPIDTIIELTLDGSAMDLAPIASASPGLVTPDMKATASVVFEKDSQYAAAKAIDGDPETRWATPSGTRECWLELDLLKPQTIGRIEIDEEFAAPKSRVKRFEIQAKTGDTWATIHTGTALGPHFNATPATLTTQHLRLRILDATDGPTISEIRLLPPARQTPPAK
jgi:alpha-L-fucosidase